MSKRKISRKKEQLKELRKLLDLYEKCVVNLGAMLCSVELLLIEKNIVAKDELKAMMQFGLKIHRELMREQKSRLQ